MSTPKKIRATYESTFRKLINTSPASKRFRQFLSSLRSPAQAFNLPITLADVRTQWLSPTPKTAKKPAKRKPVKTAAKKTTRATVKKKTKSAVKKAPTRRKTSKK